MHRGKLTASLFSSFERFFFFTTDIDFIQPKKLFSRFQIHRSILRQQPKLKKKLLLVSRSRNPQSTSFLRFPQNTFACREKEAFEIFVDHLARSELLKRASSRNRRLHWAIIEKSLYCLCIASNCFSKYQRPRAVLLK